VLVVVGVLALTAAAPTPDPTTKAIVALHWSKLPQRLEASNSTLTPPAHVAAIRGDDAAKYEKLTNGDVDSSLEAVAVNFKTGEPVFLEYTDSGYVTVDDWKDVDTSAMLQSIKDNTESGNAGKKAQGIAPIHVLDWIQKPTYDSATQTVRWAISAGVEGQSEPIVNSVALVLGRRGYEKLTWVADRNKYVGRGGMLDTVLAAQRFNPGARYADHANGDKLAGYGLTALVGTVAGATLYKVGAFAALLLLLKKLWFLGIAAVVGAWRWIASRLKGPQFGPAPAPSQEPPAKQ